MCSRFIKVAVITVVTVMAALFLKYTVHPALFGPGSVHLRLGGSADLMALMDRLGGGQDVARRTGSIPPILCRNLPVDLARLPVAEKVDLFISLMLPQVILANEEIHDERAEMLRILVKRESFQRLTSDEQWYLNRLALRYGCDSTESEQLRLRVKSLPVSLVLAQAIEESGWGTSRFALEGNSMYGQHHVGSDDGRFIPSLSGTARVAAFDSILKATRAYMLNVNGGRAYKRLRRIRQQDPGTGALSLTQGLALYSERGGDYVDSLNYLIRRYRLDELNNVRLDHSMKTYYLQFTR